MSSSTCICMVKRCGTCMDKSIHAPMRFLRSKMSDRLLKLRKGKWTRHVGGIRTRHRNSQKMNSVRTECQGENKVCIVQGANKDSYTVRQADFVPHQAAVCPLMCCECGIMCPRILMFRQRTPKHDLQTYSSCDAHTSISH